MSEFDIILIKEYEKRHGLYDQNSPYYKDKFYSTNAWREISAHLNCNVSMLKVRMIQLRCRYNNEKRKYDLLKKKHPNMKITWPLFEHLTFLNDHIKQRKRYKTQSNMHLQFPGNFDEYAMKYSTLMNPVVRRRGRPPKNYTYGDTSEDTDLMEHIACKTNMMTPDNTIIKAEPNTNSEEDDEPYVNSASFLAQTTTYINPDSASDPNPIINGVPNNLALQSNCLYETPSADNELQRTRKKRKHHNYYNQEDHNYLDTTERFHRHHDKFMAFGQFVSAALSDMNEAKALSIIESFTLTLVKTMKEG